MQLSEKETGKQFRRNLIALGLKGNPIDFAPSLLWRIGRFL